MDLNGKLISSWTAKGFIYHQWWDGLYSMNAYERWTTNPQRYYQYPLGWRVHVRGPNMVIYDVEEPLWIQQTDPLTMADRAEARAGASH